VLLEERWFVTYLARTFAKDLRNSPVRWVKVLEENLQYEHIQLSNIAIFTGQIY